MTVTLLILVLSVNMILGVNFSS